MKLAVFDLDGTLTDTNAVDDECFVQALRITFNIDAINTNWTEYSHVTDMGVMAAAFREHYGRDPDSADICRFIECFLSLLTEVHASNQDLFGQIPGAAAFLANLQNHRQWRPSIATGGWQRSAKFKMMATGINPDGIPAAFAEYGPARETIVEAAITKACTKYHTDLEKIVLVGDAVWDVRTARQLELPFVGVGSGTEAALLRGAGVSAVVENFLDQERCLELFEIAEMPKLHSHRASGQR